MRIIEGHKDNTEQLLFEPKKTESTLRVADEVSDYTERFVEEL